LAEVRIEDEVVVRAPAETVWRALADPAEHAGWHPFVTEISGEHRIGATRTCSVIVGRKAGRTSERCIVEQPGEELAWAIEEDSTGFGRMVSDWTAGFRIKESDGATAVSATSTFQPRNPMVRLMMPLIRVRFHQTQRKILAALKAAVEPDSEPDPRYEVRPASRS